MNDYGHYGGNDEEFGEIRRLNSEVDVDPDNFESWEKLIRACETLEGGLNRNSSPQALSALRDAYDRFLAKFPLFFGYWKKYADLEFNISGPESAEMIYERGCASITNSVDLWTDYCTFKTETTHVPHLVRELFERAADCVGLDFLAHPFWDKYIEYEERQDAQDKVFAILLRVIQIPMHQYARYYERFRSLCAARPLSDMASPEQLSRFRSEIEAEGAAFGIAKTEPDLDREIRGKVDAIHYENFEKSQSETTKRWTFESEIKRPYFHVTELENQQLINWRNYLDFEEEQANARRVIFLYERCLVACAFYDEFWFRYARWMSSQTGKDEEVRNIYLRATTLFVPISRPGIRLQFAYFEESCGRIGAARALHEAILGMLPGCIEVILSWANLERRQRGRDAAIDVYKNQIDSPEVDIFTKAALVSRWAMLLWRDKGSIEEARTVFTENLQWYADSREFWQTWLDFELAQPTKADSESKQGERIKHIISELRSRSRLPAATKGNFGRLYLKYLQERGGKDAMRRFLVMDRDLFGPVSVSHSNPMLKTTNGIEGVLDETTLVRAEAGYQSYFEMPTEEDATAQGPVDFN